MFYHLSHGGNASEAGLRSIRAGIGDPKAKTKAEVPDPRRLVASVTTGSANTVSASF
jgi:hypothetical protein